jgi:hypothetical protein
MKSARRLRNGPRHALLSPMVREELRALMVSDAADRSLTFTTLMTRTMWIMLVSDHTAQHQAIPSAEDCEGYRMFAELCIGDAVDHIDQRIRDSIAQRGQSADPFLQEARALKRFADEIAQREAGETQASIKQIQLRAETFLSRGGHDWQ